MIELLQQIAGFLEMIAVGIVNGIQGVTQLFPLAQQLVSYVPDFLLFPCTLVLSFAVVRFMLSLF